MTTFAQARTPRTFGVTLAQVLAAMAAAGAPVAGWSKRAPQRVMAQDFSTRTVEESEIRADMATMVDLSVLASLDSDWCDAWMTWFAETRIPALPAVWDVPFATSAPPQTISPSDVVVAQAGNGQIFELSLTVPVSLPNPLRMAARVPGVAGNVAPSTITKILSAPAGLQISGLPTLFTAGRDAETSEAAIARCLGKWAALGAGWTLASFDYLIPLFAPTLTRWRVRVDNPDGPGTIRVILANAAGPATDAEVAAVLAGLSARNRFCLGCGGLAVVKAVALTVALTATIKGDGSFPDLAHFASDALRLLSLAFPIGPAILTAELANAVLIGATVRGQLAIPTSAGGLTSTTIDPSLLVDLGGFPGAVEIVVPLAGLPLTVPAGQVLVLSPLPVITVT